MESLKDSLAAVTDMFKSSMAEFQKELQKTSPAQTSTSSLAADFVNFKKFILSALETIQKQFEFMALEIDRSEMRTRRKMILLHGIPEDSSENLAAVVTSLVADKLLVPSFSSCSISRCHRLGRPTDKKVRPVLVKFKDASVRDKVWFAKSKLKNTGITQSEFLTRKRHAVFMEARRRFGVNKCWTNKGVIHILASNGTLHQVERLVELEAIVGDPSPSTSLPPMSVAGPKKVEPRKRSPSRIRKPVRK